MSGLAEIVGDSAGIRRLREQLEQILTRAARARRPPPILLRGETGTGKGLVARTLHRAGPRADAPFVDVNCAAIPETLLEAELFGYERGAFTDARQAKPGLFQLAHRGTLFLDEIGTLSPALQAKLLKVLEDGVVRRLGGTRAEPVDVWIVSATNEDLAEALRARRFREDLYHRLAVLSVELPPLRERGSDVLLLADRFLARACADYGLPPKTLARDARAALAAYAWPGNVRELGNVVERVALLADEPVVTAAMLALPATSPADDPPGAEPAPARSSRDQMRAHLLEMLTETGGNISEAARRLGVARNTVLARMARFGLNAAATTSPAGPRPGGGPRRDAPATAPTEASIPIVAPSRAVWEPRRVALLRFDVVKPAGAADASRALDEAIGKVQIFGGEIVELGPEALVAGFGLEAVEDAPIRAALAALAILRASERARADGAGSRVKIVVHVAQALVSQHQATVTIDLEGKRAAWTTIEALLGLDALDTIVVSEDAAPFLDRRFELAPAAADDAVPFRRLTRREPTGFGLGGRPLSPFVGREAEVRLVTDRLAGAERGRGEVIGIVGEPGVGKSRFMYELTRLDATHGWRVLGGRGMSHGSTTPLLPVSDLLRRYFAIEDADDPQVIRAKVTETILSRHEDLTSFLTPLLSLLDIAIDDPSWSRLDPPLQRQRIQEAVKRLLLHESRVQPLVVIVEDLHWIDTATQALLDGLVESLPTARLLLLVNYRPEYQHRWASKTYYSQLRLDALSPDGAAEFLAAVLGEDSTLEPLKRLLIRRGNPFFMEESIQTLVETGALVGERGVYRLARPIQVIEIPATVQIILASRIERLSVDAKQLLQTASVIGKDVPFVLLHAVSQIPEDDLYQRLSHLQAAEFLYETRGFPDSEYIFKHALTHDVTYGTLLQDRRKDLHARVVDAIERIYPDRLTEHVERLADHALRGELWEKAVTYLREAGLKAQARSADREAVQWLEQALAALAHRPESRQTTEQAIDLRLDLRRALYVLGEFQRMVGYLREADVLAKALGDPRRRGQLSVAMCHVIRMGGHSEEAIAFGQEAVAIAESLGDLPLRITANHSLGMACVGTGHYRQAEDPLLEALRLLEGEQRPQQYGWTGFPAASTRGQLTLALGEMGRFDEGDALGEDAIRIAEPLGHPHTLTAACSFLAQLRMTRGEFDRAISVIERGLAAIEEQNVPLFSLLHRGSLGQAYARLGRTAEGIALQEYALSEIEATGHAPLLLSGRLVTLGESYVLANRLDDALAVGGRALTISREYGHRNSEAKALGLLGDIAARRDSPGGAEGHYREAQALAEALGMRPLVAHCHAGLWQLFERMGKREEASRHQTAATTMYGEMKMTYWLEKVSTG